MDYKQEIINSIIEQGRGTGDDNLFFNLTKELRGDKDIAISAITSDILSVSYLPESLKKDSQFLNSFKVTF